MAARKNFSTGQIINALRKAEVGIANGKAIKDVCRELGVSEQTYSRLISFTDLPRARPTSEPVNASETLLGIN